MAIRNEEGTTVIGRGAVVRGELIAGGDLVVEGVVEGTVRAEGTRVTVGKDARLRAEIVAQEVVVLGTVEGNLRASERVELRSGAGVTGDVFAKRFAMEEGAVLRGRVDPTRAGEPVNVGGGGVTASGTAKAAAAVSEKAPAGGLFDAAPSRPVGQMPAGLAAAARSINSSAAPAGLSALAVEESTSAREGSNA